MPFRSLLFTALVMATTSLFAADTEDAPTLPELDRETQSLKHDILDLRAELLRLERDVRYPAADRWTVFVTADPIEDFELERLVLKLDGDTIAEHQYDADERKALAEAGAHRLHIGTLTVGRHEITAELAGRHEGESYRRIQTFAVDKPEGARLMALKLHPRVARAEGEPAEPGLLPRHLDDLP